MKLSAIALDYDGTIARGDVLDSSVREAIALARAKGVVVLLVTGRILDELRRVAGDLHFVDVVVAENGAVVHFPGSGHTSLLAPRMSETFVAELRRRSIPFGLGECLVDARASEAPRLLEAIRALQLPLVLIFNGGQVMTLPQGVSKATGLRAALDTLRLSARNTVAIGDAENDHELLRLAEVGVAVGWGSAALQRSADLVLPGSGPAAVAAYVRALALGGRLPVAPRARRRLRLGYRDDGREFSLAVRGRNALIAGDARSGKSWVAGLFCEQLIMHGYCLCVIDPEGDYAPLEALPGVTVLGGEDPPPTPRELLRALRYPDRSVVIDLSRRPHEEKVQYVRALLTAVNVVRRRTGLPHRIVLDEAHYYLQGPDAEDLLDLERDGYIVVTYRPSRLPAALLADTEVMIVTCESNPAEMNALYAYCAGYAPGGRGRWSRLPHLKKGQAAALAVTEEAEGTLDVFTVAPRLTPHVRHRQKYVDVPVGGHHAFYFAPNGETPRRAHTLRQFVTILEATPAVQLQPYIRRGDFSRWIRDVLGDHSLAVELRGIEARQGEASAAALAAEITTSIRARYEFDDEGGAGVPASLPQDEPGAVAAGWQTLPGGDR